MDTQRILELDTGFSLAQWRKNSENGDFCGILGCFNKPVTICKHCGNHYCEEHKWVMDTPAHGK